METSHYHGLYLLLVAGRSLDGEPKAIVFVEIPLRVGPVACGVSESV